MVVAGRDAVIPSAPRRTGGLVATDASATQSSSGGALVRSSGTQAPPSGRVFPRIQGQQAERSISCHGEMMAAIVLAMNTGADSRLPWTGDNIPVQDVYKIFQDEACENARWRPPRSWKLAPALRHWLLHQVRRRFARSIIVEVVHQRSHLSLATEALRRKDRCVLLEHADSAVGHGPGAFAGVGGEH